MPKSLKTYSMNLPEEEYHAYPAWSYSMIAKYAEKGFAGLATLHERTEPTPSMEFGSLFDSMITKGRQTLDEYVVMKNDVPQAEKKVLKKLATMTKESNLMNVPKDIILEACNETGYQPTWGFDAKFRHLNEYAEYFRTLESGKKIVSIKDWEDAKEMMRIFRNDPYIKTVFGTKNTKDIEYLYQTQFLIDWTSDDGETVKIKIMPDLLKVNHNAKTIQPVDLKTSSIPGWQFKDNFVKFRYDIQATLYTYVLQQIINQDEEYKDYEIMPYLFCDISRSDMVPVSYMYDQFAQADGLSFKGYQYKNWSTLLNEILRYERQCAVVPDYIRRDGPNDLIDILNNR